VQAIQERQGMKIACLEEIAWLNNWIDSKQFLAASKRYAESTEYRQYLEQLYMTRMT
jgi:glucose-1-phosphate thymidylyltransferase